MGGAGLRLKDFLRARRQRRRHRKGYAPFPCLPDSVAHGNRSHANACTACGDKPHADACDQSPNAVRRRVLHLYRLYAVMKAVYDGHKVHQIGKGEGPYHLFLKAVQMLEAFEARTQIPVDDNVFVLSVFAYYGKDTWPGMFCHEDVLTHYQRDERRTVHETVTTAPVDEALLQRVAEAGALRVAVKSITPADRHRLFWDLAGGLCQSPPSHARHDHPCAYCPMRVTANTARQ